MPEEANAFFCRLFGSSSPSARQPECMAVQCTLYTTGYRKRRNVKREVRQVRMEESQIRLELKSMGLF
jgi:hypothetical protein